MSNITSFTLVSASTQAAAPFALGHTFKVGDVPAGSQVVSSISDFQCVPKNTWPDGSLRIAVLSGRAALTANVALSVPLSTGTPAGGTALSTTNLKATGIVASIGCGAFGTATWVTTDWDAPFEAWISGPKMSSWIYRKPVGSDSHLVAWLEVRLWAGGEVEVLPWIENGYLRVAGATNKSATYTFSLGGSQRYSGAIDLKHHQRTPLINGTALAYWLGTDPGVTPIHGKTYMQAAEQVPTYMASSPAYDSNNQFLRATPSSYDSLVTSFSPLAAGNFTYDYDAMPSPGYQSPIGLLPTHDVAYLVCTTQPALLYAAVVRNGFCAGRYATHYRDETTQRPPAFSTYPTLVMYDDDTYKDTGSSTNLTFSAATSGGSAPQYDIAHSPSIGYMAYLVTGRFYFKEEAQFVATANHFHITDWVRGAGTGTPAYTPMATYTGASGIWTSAIQTRTGAWGFRALTQALAITPDSGDPLRSELITSVEENCRYFWQIYVAQANNPYGIIKGSSSETYTDVATDRLMIPGWQQDFSTGAWGMALCLGLPISSTAAARMAAFFQWKAKFAVHRLGTNAGFHYENAASYEYAASPSTAPDFYTGTGPWYADDAAVYAATYTGSQTPNSSTAGVLGIVPGSSEVGTWANLQIAISYAVRHGVPGALAARARMTSASNWSTYIAGFTNAPVWSVQPSSAGASGGPVPVTGKTARVDAGDWRAPAGYAVVSSTGGMGPLSQTVPSTGADGPGLLYPWLQPADSNCEVGITLVSGPPAGSTLRLGEDGSVYYSGAPGSFTVQAWLGGLPIDTPKTITLTTGGAILVSSDLDITYQIAALVPSDLSMTYQIAALVRSDLQVVYSLLSGNVPTPNPAASRTVPFEGGSRTVPFEGGNRIVRF